MPYRNLSLRELGTRAGLKLTHETSKAQTVQAASGPLAWVGSFTGQATRSDRANDYDFRPAHLGAQKNAGVSLRLQLVFMPLAMPAFNALQFVYKFACNTGLTRSAAYQTKPRSSLQPQTGLRVRDARSGPGHYDGKVGRQTRAGQREPPPGQTLWSKESLLAEESPRRRRRRSLSTGAGLGAGQRS